MSCRIRGYRQYSKHDQNEATVTTKGIKSYVNIRLLHPFAKSIGTGSSNSRRKGKVVKIIKYFRNTHLPAARYKASGSKNLVLPHEVRLNTMSDCLESYIANRPIFVKKVYEEHSDENF